MEVSIPCLAGHSFSRRSVAGAPARRGGMSQSPVWRGIHSHIAYLLDRITDRDLRVSIPCLAGHSFSRPISRRIRSGFLARCLNPLFGGAFILTMVRACSMRRIDHEDVSIPCLAGHSFSRDQETDRQLRRSVCVSQSPVWRGIHSHSSPAAARRNLTFCPSQSPVWRGIHSHPERSSRRRRSRSTGLNPLFGGAFILTSCP